MGKIYIGTSGWTYPKWRGHFYPKKLSQKKELEYLSSRVNSIEINGTFYRMQTPASFQRWYESTPKDFCFSVKASQYITHIRRLKEVDTGLSNFFATGLLSLREKLGPILWQFPPNVKLKDDRFEKFLKKLPTTSKQAAKLAKNHSPKIRDIVWEGPVGNFKIRHAFEFRHESFMNRDFIDLLRSHNVALVFAHAGRKSPYQEDITADFVYARLHGEGPTFKKGYGKKDIEAWAKKVTSWSEGRVPRDSKCLDKKNIAKCAQRDVFLYFDSEAKMTVPDNAIALASKIVQKPAKKRRAY